MSWQFEATTLHGCGDINNPVLHIQFSNLPHCFATLLLQQPHLRKLMLTWELTKNSFKAEVCHQLLYPVAQTNTITDGRLLRVKENEFSMSLSFRDEKYKATPILLHVWHNRFLSLGQM